MEVKADLIIDAANRGDLLLVQQLIRDNPELVKVKDDEGWTALRWALCKEHEDVAQFLLAAGSEPVAGYIGTKRYASRMSRFLNFIVDLIIVRLALYPVAHALSHSDHRLALRLYVLLFVVYYVVFEATLQKTPMKFITRTKVVSLDGSKPSINQIIGRSFSRIVPLEPFSTFFSDGWWHDKWSGTIVVKQ